MKTFVKIVRKNEKSDNVTLKAVTIMPGIDREKLHHPDLRSRIECALKDFHLKLEEGEDVRFSRMMDRDITLEELDTFENKCIGMSIFINELEIPAKEEQNLPVSQEEDNPEEMDENETKFIQNLLNDMNSANEIFRMDFRIMLEEDDCDGMITGAMTPQLTKRLLKTYLEKYG